MRRDRDVLEHAHRGLLGVEDLADRGQVVEQRLVGQLLIKAGQAESEFS
jgi:hypothetical protein